MKTIIEIVRHQEIKMISLYTATNPLAVEEFVSEHSLNTTKLLNYVTTGLPEKMDFVGAIAGYKHNNPSLTKIKKLV